MRRREFICLAAGAAGLSTRAKAQDLERFPTGEVSQNAPKSYRLRGFRGLRHIVAHQVGDQPSTSVHRFTLDDSQRAKWFASKIYSDFALTLGNKTTVIPTAHGPDDAIDFGGEGILAPLIQYGSQDVYVVVGNSRNEVTKEVAALATAAPAARSRAHPPALHGQMGPLSSGSLAEFGRLR